MASRMFRRFKKYLPWILAFLFMVWLYRDIDLSSLRSTLSDEVNYPILFSSLIFGLAANVIRGIRWKILIDPLTEKTPKTRSINLILITLGTYCVNMLLPRAGEFWRCFAINKYEKLSFGSVLGTVTIERLLDTLVISLFALLLLLGYSGELQLLWDSLPYTSTTLSPLFTISIVLVVLLGIGLWAWCYRDKIRHRYPKIHQFASQFAEGLRMALQLPYPARFICYTFLIWILYFFFFYTTFGAFDFTESLGWKIGFFAFTLSCLAILIPVQAGMGTWHYAVILSLTFYGVEQSHAENFALIVHTIQTLWTTITGLFAIFVLPLINKRYQRVSCDEEKEH